jgi:EpsG family
VKLIISLILIALCFILAGRDPAIFADGDNYAEYVELVQAEIDVHAEPSFYFVVELVGELGLYGVFFVYLMLGFFLKGMYFLLKMPVGFHLILIYLTNYFVIHDLVQIRVGAALGLALWAVYYFGERNIRIASLLMLASFLLHFSVAILAVFTFFIYAVDNGKIKGLNVVRFGYALFLVSCLLLVLTFLLEFSFLDILLYFSDRNEFLPKRYVENYLQLGESIGFLKIIYSFALAFVALYALHRDLLLKFVARHAALSLIGASLLLIAFKDIPVIGARLADTLLFFAPFMLFGLHATKPVLGRVVFFSMLTIQVVNLAFISTVIRL